MKIRLLLALVLMTFSVFGQNVPSYVPTNGLVGWWPFNGNANDESGNGNNGMVNGATLTSDRFGVANNAYDFNGSTWIDMTVNGASSGNNEATLAAWFYRTTGPGGVQYMVAYGNPANVGEVFAMGEYGAQGAFTTFSGGQFDAQSQLILPNNSWHQLVGIHRQNGWIEIYLDATLIFTDTVATPNIQTLLGRIGRAAWNSGEFWVGSLDDIGIWNRALTQQEITNLYNASTSIPIISCPGASMPLNLNNGLVGWWPFCGDAEDESGNGNNGTVNGATLTSDRFGNGNSAYEFDGLDDYIQTAANFTPGNSSKSLSTWVKFDDLFDRGWIVSNNTCINGSDYDGFGFFEEGPSQSFYFYGMNNGDRLLPVNFDTTIFHHLVATYDQDTLKAYVDGVIVSSTFNPLNTNSNNGILFGDRFTGLLSGSCGNDNTIDGLFRGIIDDIGIWNRALDSSEVAQLYNTGLCTQTIAGSCDTLIFNANITGFNPVTYANQIRVYPNPARDNLVIDCGTNYTGLNGYSILITNLLGQTVYNSPVTAQITNIQLTPPTWVNGTYVVQFVHPNGTVVDTKRIIIQ